MINTLSPAQLDIVNQAIAILEGAIAAGPVLDNPSAAITFLRLKFAGLQHEVFATLWLDSQHRVLGLEELFRGTIDAAAVYPREVVKAALAVNAAAVILCHNHPSGIATPSSADIAITERLQKALELVGVRVLDHMVVGREGAVSFAERGLL